MSQSIASNWKVVTPSAFPWEQAALDFVRERFPPHEPYRAWTNFEFIADDGSVNEVDLLVFSPQGLFLIEIKSDPGRLDGDARTWTWTLAGRSKAVDNPLYQANLKAKKLRSLLQRQKAFAERPCPFIEPLIFCSAENLISNLSGNAAFRVCLRDTDSTSGIMGAIKRRECSGLPPAGRGIHDRPTAKSLARAIEQAGIRPSQRSRRVGDYELREMLDEGPGYQDFLGVHISIPNTERRIRIYVVQTGASTEQREMIRRAAEREFRLLQAMEHRGVLRAMDFTNHELGPAIIFQHHRDAIRLDHFLVQQGARLTDDIRLAILRQIAETVRYAHEKNVVHRALCPQAILIRQTGGLAPQPIITNWQLGYRAPASPEANVTRLVTATVHVSELADDAAKLFMAPESLLDGESLGTHHDLFSLGAITYQLFTGRAPAEDLASLGERLRAEGGLKVTSVLNGAPESLQDLVRLSTDPDVGSRLDSAEEFLKQLDHLEEELTRPDDEFSGDPTSAKAGDLLPGNFFVKERLGSGSTAVALLAEKDGKEIVLKIAVDVEHNDRVREEGEVLQKLKSPLIVALHEVVQIGDRVALVMDRAGAKTLGRRLRDEGRLSLDLLQRFGDDLLDALVLLEKEGIAHRDIKPENIGVSSARRGNELHLVLFDFSLSRCASDNIRAGTPGYLDPFLPLRKPPRWDLQAERFAAAVTLYQMATGALPKWSGGSDPLLIKDEVTLEAEIFPSEIRDRLRDFFGRALRREARERFDNAHAMREAWLDVFATTHTSDGTTTSDSAPDPAPKLATATLDTSVAELGLGAAAVDALDRLNVIRVRDLLGTHRRRLARMRGVGNKTRKLILAATRVLQERLGTPAPEPDLTTTQTGEEIDPSPSGLAFDEYPVDMVAARILRKPKGDHDTEFAVVRALVGLEPTIEALWPSQGEVAEFVGITRGRVSQLFVAAQKRWLKSPLFASVRASIVQMLERTGGAMSVSEIADELVRMRGSNDEEPLRSRSARAVARAAVEAEQLTIDPRFLVRREGNNAIIASDMSLADYAVSLGRKADEIASSDPLMTPVRTLDLLREIAVPPEADPLPDARLLRLAAAASQSAALSSRQELYPRGMDAARTLKLSQGALVGSPKLTPQQIRERVASRYPYAADLPPRPELDQLLRDAGIDLHWDFEESCYRSTARNPFTITRTSSATLSRYSTADRTNSTAVGAGDESFPGYRPSFVSPDVASARAFDERLRRASVSGAFIALTVGLKEYIPARRELVRQHDVAPLDLEAIFIRSLREAAAEVGADWDVVVRADAADRGSSDWRNLNLLISTRVISKIEQAVLDAGKPSPGESKGPTLLAYYINWLARYDQVPLLTRLADHVNAGRLHGLWLLIPASQNTEMPVLDGIAVPVITTSQWARIPDAWCRNLHRADHRKTGHTTESVLDARGVT